MNHILLITLSIALSLFGLTAVGASLWLLRELHTTRRALVTLRRKWLRAQFHTARVRSV
jgi:hypothetical protein